MISYQSNAAKYLRLNSLVLIISKLAPLVKPIKLKFATVATSRLFQEIILGPLVLHALIA